MPEDAFEESGPSQKLQIKVRQLDLVCGVLPISGIFEFCGVPAYLYEGHTPNKFALVVYRPPIAQCYKKYQTSRITYVVMSIIHTSTWWEWW